MVLGVRVKKLIFFMIIVAAFLGCKKDCVQHCEGNVWYYCIETEDIFGHKDEYRHLDCSKKGLECVEFGPVWDVRSGCLLRTDRCNSELESICVDKKPSYCIEDDGNFFAIVPDYSYCDKDEECIEFGVKAECMVPVNECDTQAWRTCVNNNVSVCYEQNGDYYAVFTDRCESDKCVELNDNVQCLSPVESCRPSENPICYDNYISHCYFNAGEYFLSYDEDCGRKKDGICVEIGQSDADCLTSVSKCDPTKESFCLENEITKCYEKDGQFFISSIRDCDYTVEGACKEPYDNEVKCLSLVDECDSTSKSFCGEKNTIKKCHKMDDGFYLEHIGACNSDSQDECIYDPETKSAHCLSED